VVDAGYGAMPELYMKGAAEEGTLHTVSGLAWRRFRSGWCMTAAACWTLVGVVACDGGGISAPTATPSAVKDTARMTIDITLSGAIAAAG
jgi:hypothetical protein